MTRLRPAVVTAATALTVLAPAAAHAEPTPFGELVRASDSWGPYSLDAACHFGPTRTTMETTVEVQGVATATAAARTSIRCWIEHGNGTWNDVYESSTEGGVTVTTGTSHLWWGSYDRLCVSASAEYTFMDHLVAEPVCVDA